MKIEKEENNGVTTLKLSGCLDTAANEEFATAMVSVQDVQSLVIDFSGLDFIASSGIRTLVSANKKAIAEGRSITLTHLNEVVADVFDVTGLNDYFTIK